MSANAPRSTTASPRAQRIDLVSADQMLNLLEHFGIGFRHQLGAEGLHLAHEIVRHRVKRDAHDFRKRCRPGVLAFCRNFLAQALSRTKAGEYNREVRPAEESLHPLRDGGDLDLLPHVEREDLAFFRERSRAEDELGGL